MNLVEVADLSARQLVQAAVRKRTDVKLVHVLKVVKRYYSVVVDFEKQGFASRRVGLVPGFVVRYGR
jgi:hypothetical protein